MKLHFFAVLSLVKLVSSVDDPLAIVASDVNQFDLDIGETFHLETDNIVWSPVSTAMSLGMLLRGAKGKTAQEIKQLFSLRNVDDDDIHSKFAKLLKDEEKTPRRAVSLRIANLGLVSTDIKYKSEYATFVRDKYDALFESADFKSNGQEAVNVANDFLKQKTNGLVPSIFDKPLDKNTKLAVVSSLFFNATWVNKFPKVNTKKASFKNYDNTISQVDTMNQVGTFQTCRMTDVDGSLIELQFNNDVSMLIGVPDRGEDLMTVTKSLTAAKIHDCLANGKLENFNIYLPKFKLDSTFNLTDSLKKCGAKSMFDPSTADFSNIAEQKPLYVSTLAHRAVIGFNEDGANASGGQGGQVTGGAGQPKAKDFKINQPFAFGIFDNVHKMLLFGSTVNKL